MATTYTHSTKPDSGRLGRLAHFTARYRWPVIATWIVLTLIGGVAAGKLSTRWYQSTAIPGKSAYEGSQRTLKALGAGVRPPNVVVFHSASLDVTKSSAVRTAMARVAKANPGALTSSYFSTGSLMYASRDRHTTFLQVYPPGPNRLDVKSGAAKMRAVAAAGLPAAITVNVTGYQPLEEATKVGSSGGSSVLLEALIGGLGALVILLFVFGTLPAVLMPLVVAVAAILNTFTLVWALTYITNVSIIVQFLIALVGLGVAIDYALLMIFRFRDELREGEDVETALVATLGTRINSVRLLPKRFVDSGHPEDGWWGRWATFVMRRPLPVAVIGVAIVGTLVFYGVQLNPSEAQVKDFPGSGDAIVGRATLANAGISAGVMKPFDILVEGGRSTAPIVAKLRATPGIAGAVAPPDWRKGSSSIVEAFATTDGASKPARSTIKRVRAALDGTGGTLGGLAAEDRDFVKAVYSNFPYVLGFVVLLTFILLSRAFRSLVLALKAVVLNLVSLAAAYGIIVIVFQLGHGSEAIWSVHATRAIIPWIPLMIFAFLFGLSMDYEVFMLTRMREAFAETGDTEQAIELGLARTGKLVTSAALILMFAFLVLSASPGFEIKEFAIGLAAGIIFDATVIRALLVPALMRLLGSANWWMPDWTRTALFITRAEPPPEGAADN